jgi:hypothetical protein
MEKLRRIDQFLENVKGDAAAIRAYIKSLQKGYQKKPSFEQTLDMAERAILSPTPSAGLRLPPTSKPKSDERPREPGVVLWRF